MTFHETKSPTIIGKKSPLTPNVQMLIPTALKENLSPLKESTEELFERASSAKMQKDFTFKISNASPVRDFSRLDSCMELRN